MKKIIFILALVAASFAHADLIARLLAERLGPAIGETVIVQNRPGQGGV